MVCALHVVSFIGRERIRDEINAKGLTLSDHTGWRIHLAHELIDFATKPAALGKADIRGLFCEYCDVLGIRWTQPNHRNISVSHRDSVAAMDEFIGPKRCPSSKRHGRSLRHRSRRPAGE